MFMFFHALALALGLFGGLGGGFTHFGGAGAMSASMGPPDGGGTMPGPGGGGVGSSQSGG